MERTVLARLCAVLVLACVAGAAAAQAWPSRQIRLINGFAPGGSSDIVARIVAQKLSESLGQQVVVETRTGSGGIIANEAVATAAPDGYTLLLVTGAFPVQAAVMKKLPYDPLRAFAMVSMLTTYPFVIAVNAASPVKSLPELIAHARANPGKLNFSSAGIGTVHHLSGELFNAMAQTDLVHVPYRGGTAPVTELLAGRVDVMFETMTLALPQVKSGKVRALAVTSTQRSPFLPDVPTAAETLPGFDVVSWLGIATTAGTPPEIVTRLSREVARALESPDVRQRLADLGGEARPTSGAEMLAHVEAEMAKWRRIAQARGIEAPQ
jgi:tripartite-type tricarboxylate transporter receptor subunit TctC